jgi:hypothetical protein
MGYPKLALMAVLLGLVAASLYLTVLLGSPGSLILVYLTQLPLFVAGLWLGTAGAGLAGLTACLVLLVASDLMAAVLFAGLNAIPVGILVRQALRARQRADGKTEWYPPGLLTVWLAGLAIAGMVIAVLLEGGPDGIQAELREVLAPIVGRLIVAGSEDREQVTLAMAVIAPGIVAASWMVMATINAALAQGLLVRFRANWRPSPDIAALSLPSWTAGLVAAAAVATVFGGALRFFGANTVLILAVAFCFAGFAVLHAIARVMARPAMVLTAFYAMAALFGWPLLVIMLVGLFEPWLALRRRFAPNSLSGGTIDG